MRYAPEILKIRSTLGPDVQVQIVPQRPRGYRIRVWRIGGEPVADVIAPTLTEAVEAATMAGCVDAR